MTGLRGTNPKEYEFFTPSIDDFAEHLGNEDNAGIPGQDPFPRADRTGVPHLLENERLIGSWQARRLHRGLRFGSGTPESWAIKDGQWLREELASLGAVRIVLTSLRLAVAIPQTRLNRQTYEVVIRPVRKRGEGPAVKPSIKDRALLGAIGRAGRGGGQIGEFARDMVGDMPAVAGHLALETISSVRWPADGMRGPVVVTTAIGRGSRMGRGEGSLPGQKLLALELDVSGAQPGELADALVTAIQTRLAAFELPRAVQHAIADSPRSRADSEIVYECPLMRPIGSTEVLISATARQTWPELPEQLAMPALAEPPEAHLAAAEPTRPEQSPPRTRCFCHQCGATGADTDTFCADCGARQEET